MGGLFSKKNNVRTLTRRNTKFNKSALKPEPSLQGSPSYTSKNLRRTVSFNRVVQERVFFEANKKDASDLPTVSSSGQAPIPGCTTPAMIFDVTSSSDGQGGVVTSEKPSDSVLSPTDAHDPASPTASQISFQLGRRPSKPSLSSPTHLARSPSTNAPVGIPQSGHSQGGGGRLHLAALRCPDLRRCASS